MAFTRKRIDLTISLGTGQFGDSGANTVTLTGLRTQVEAQAPGGEAQGQATVRVYGLPASMLNQLTTLGFAPSATRFFNQCLIAAGDDGDALALIHAGTINQAWADYNEVPNACLEIQSVGGLAENLKPVAARSYIGSTDVATIMQDIAGTMGVGFENNGVDVKLSNPYLPGTALAQMRSCARAADIYAQLDRGVLAIWPKDGYRSGDIPLVSPETGMVGFPTFSSQGVMVRTLFNPALKLGGRLQVASSLPPACGIWTAAQVHHRLESETPNGAWFTEVFAVRGGE